MFQRLSIDTCFNGVRGEGICPRGCWLCLSQVSYVIIAYIHINIYMYISSMQVLRLETKSCKITVKLYSSSLKSYENFDRPAFSPIIIGASNMH